MPTIELSNGQRARVDWQDYKRLARFRWDVNQGYAIRHVGYGVGRTTVRMHREILGLGSGLFDKRQTDHKNRDRLDNRRRNLRVCTSLENSENRSDQSVFGVGVWKDPLAQSNRFRAKIMIQGKRHHLGCFPTAEEARYARRKFLAGRA